MPSKEVVTFWLDMGAPMGLLPRVRVAAAPEKGRIPGQPTSRPRLYRAYTGASDAARASKGGSAHAPDVHLVAHERSPTTASREPLDGTDRFGGRHGARRRGCGHGRDPRRERRVSGLLREARRFAAGDRPRPRAVPVERAPDRLERGRPARTARSAGRPRSDRSDRPDRGDGCRRRHRPAGPHRS
jgi:hypothetical protein